MKRMGIGFGFFVLLVAVALGLPTIFGIPRAEDGTGGDPWRNYIYDFQTLIGGFLALIAAYITLHQMKESDALQERRHQQQISAVNRRDVLIIDRFAKAFLQWLRRDLDRMQGALAVATTSVAISPDIDAQAVEIAWPPEWDQVRAHMTEFGDALKDVREYFGDGVVRVGDQRLIDASALFSPAMYNKSLYVIRALDAFVLHVGNVQTFRAAATRPVTPNWYDPTMLHLLGGVWLALRDFLNEAEQLAAEIAPVNDQFNPAHTTRVI